MAGVLAAAESATAERDPVHTVSGPTPTQRALVELALAYSYLEEDFAKAAFEHAQAMRRMRDLAMGSRGVRVARPYEGSLIAELRHAVFRWRSYRRR